MRTADPMPLTYEACLNYVDSQVFRFRPSDYELKHPKWPGQVGLEIEMLAYQLDDTAASGARLIRLRDGQPNSRAIIEEIAELNPEWVPEYDEAADLMMRVKLDEGDQITFEPGGQIEFSSVPYPCLSDALKRMNNVQNTLRSHFRTRDVELVQFGINPWETVDEIGLQMSKPRYRAMDQHFTEIGPMGRRMMRQTATVQVNLDFGDNGEVMAKRFLLSNLLSPYATAIFANSPQVNGKLNGEVRSERSLAWRGIDHDRTGIPDLSEIIKNGTKESCVQVYLKFLLDASVVFITALDYERPAKRLTFREWMTDGYKGVFPTEDDFVSHLSLHFPEVRTRGFLELRAVDCQARPWQSVPAAFFSALLYVPDCMDQALDLLIPNADQVELQLQQAALGLSNQEMSKVAAQLMAIAQTGFSQLPPCFQGEDTEWALANFIEHFTSKGRCPADDLIEHAQAQQRSLTKADFEAIERNWFQLI